MSDKKYYREVAKSLDKAYGDKAIVTQVYTVKEQKKLYDAGILDKAYDKKKHITCDVRLLDGTLIDGVYLSPANITSSSIVYDGSTESPTGDTPVQIPEIGSYVYIVYIGKNQAFVSVQTNVSHIIVGSSQGAYLNMYNLEGSRILDLKNCDVFNVDFGNGRTFNISTDSNDKSTLLMILETIKLNVPGSEIYLGMESDKPVLKFNMESGGKITIRNDITSHLVILEKIIDALSKYFNNVGPGLTIANPALTQVMVDVLKLLSEAKANAKSLYAN